MNVSAPVCALIANSAASVPPLIEKTSVSPSRSLAVTSETAAPPSAMPDAGAEVIVTPSLTLPTVTAIALVAVKLPSEALTTTE